jgi:hypothetical protein
MSLCTQGLKSSVHASVPQWKERIAQVLTEQGALTERQIMQAIGEIS